MDKAVNARVKTIDRSRLVAGFVMAGLLAGANLAVQAAGFNPIADSYTEESSSGSNNGTGSRLRIQSSASGDGQIAFFKFDVSGVTGPVISATLKLYANSGSGEPVTAYAVNDNSWTESGITWSNQPELGDALDTINVGDGVYNHFDVRSLITSNGIYSIAIQGDTDVQQSFRSREDANLPILTISTNSLSEFEIVSSPYPTDDILVISESAADHGIANDGSVDVTSDIQDLLDLVQSKGGGTAFLPEGTYRIDGNLIIPSGVWLRGVWGEPTAGQPINGTVLAIYGGRGSTNSIPVIHHLESSGSKDLVFWYPEQNPTNIVPYPPTIGGYRAIEGDYKGLQRAVGMNNLTFVNSYIAISAIAENPEDSVGAHFNINNVYGTALYRGIQSGYISGNSKWTGLFFSPDYWSGSGFPGSPSDSSHETWAKNNGAGIWLSTKGQLYIQCARFSGFKWGLLQVHEGTDTSLYDTHFTNCQIGMTVTAYSTRAVNCVFEGSQYGLEWDESDNNMGEGVYHSCTFSGGTASVNIPDCESQDFQACTFNDKVVLSDGVLTAVDCDFNFSGTHVELTNRAEGLALMGNRYTGGFNLDDGSIDCWVKVDHTPLTFKQRPSFTYADYRTTVQDFKPAVAQLFDALDYGAVGDGVTDDTAAIQATIDAAAAAGGAIAFLPPRIYNVPGTLNVPSNVELRGSSDGHHSANGDLYATLLLVSNDHGNANGTPFITLQANSGLRGMSFFYPNQDAPFYDYPYLVRGAGANVYVFNTHAPNVSRMCDFATYRCDNFVAYNVYQGALHNGYNVGNGTTGGRIYGGMGKSFWGQLPSAIEPSYPATDPDHFATEFMHHIMAGDCTNLVVFGNYCRSNNTGIETYDEGGKGPSGMLIMNTGGEGTRVCYEINKLSSDLHILTSGNKCGSAQANDPIQAQFKLDYSDPYTVAVAGNVMDTSGEMEVTVYDGNLEISTTRLDQQVARSGCWVDAGASLRMSCTYFPEVAVFDGPGTIDLVGCHMREGAADSNPARLNDYWNENIVEKLARCAVACTYEIPYFAGMEILDTADSDYIYSVDPYNENNWYSCTRPVLVPGENKKRLYLDVVNPDLVDLITEGKLGLGYHTLDTAGVVGDTMVNVYYDANGQTLAGSFDAADTSLTGKWKNISFDITDANFNNGINGGDVLIEIGADAVVSILYVEIRDGNNVDYLPDTTPPAAPSGLEAVAGDQSVSLDWADNTEEDLAGYSVYRGTNSGGYGSALVTNWVSSDYIDDTALNGITYYYVVTASDTNSNESAASGEASATPSLAQAGSGIIVDFENIGPETTQSGIFSNLNAVITGSNAAMVPTGSLDAAMDPGETFGFIVQGVDDWVYADAVAAGNKLSYLGGLNTAAGLAGSAAGWGPGDAQRNENFDNPGEALVIEFDLSGLTAAHQSDFRLEGLGIANWNNGVDVYNYMVIDVSGNTITASADTQQSENLPLDITIYDGDYLIVGYESGVFNLDRLILNVVENVPELDGYDAWALDYGGTAVIGSSTHDYDGDGQVNLAEYALGGNPTNRLDHGEAPSMHTADSGMRYIHPQRSDDLELTYAVEVSTNLISGGWTHDGVTVIGTNLTEETLKTVTNQIPDAEPKLFIRLKVAR